MIDGSLGGSLRRPLDRAWRAVRPATLGLVCYGRAQRILRAYASHHAAARREFQRAGCVEPPAIASVGELGVRVIRPGEARGILRLPDAFAKDVATIAASVADRLDHPGACVFVPPLPAGETGVRTIDLPAVQQGRVLMIQLRSPLEIPGLEAVCEPMVDQVERRVFGSYATVEKAYVYRTPVSDQNPQGSWLWHYDNHPHEIVKVMVYLTDVTGESGPFEYLRCARSKTPLGGSPIAPLYGNSRVPEGAIRAHLDAGYERHEVTGPRGTTIVFDNNVVHRATVASGAHRDVLVLQLRPATSRLRPCLSPSRTGSFQHAPFGVNPWRLEPTVRRSYHFS